MPLRFVGNVIWYQSNHSGMHLPPVKSLMHMMECTVGSFDETVILLFVRLFSTNNQHVVLERYINVTAVHIWQFDADPECRTEDVDELT